ncbi:hypothetical protein [Methanobrevibacter sp.]|uniref:hypothetical protein n=1 Tax=Methanobrevibacter sp. TaxID=66852 RepID=UPI003866E322
MEKQISKLKTDLATRSNETAVLRDLIDYAEDIILEQCSDYYIHQWLNYKENRLELLK